MLISWKLSPGSWQTLTEANYHAGDFNGISIT
jgi:hypothetical protein